MLGRPGLDAGDDEADVDLDQSLACFLCDAASEPYATLLMPDPADQRTWIALPLCPECAALPKPRQLHRALRILKRWAPPGR